MHFFRVLKLLFTYGPELDQMVRDIREKKQQEEWESRQHNLKLCYKHRQESYRSHYSENNCDYCKLKKATRPCD